MEQLRCALGDAVAGDSDAQRQFWQFGVAAVTRGRAKPVVVALVVDLLAPRWGCLYGAGSFVPLWWLLLFYPPAAVVTVLFTD